MVAICYTSSLLVFPQIAQGSSSQAGDLAESHMVRTNTGKTSPFHALSVTKKAKDYYSAVWGVDNLHVEWTASGNLIRFSYRVSDPERANALNDKSATPYLIGQRSHAMLKIPVMDKIGQLRQSSKPEAGKHYWMVFSNKGNLVKAGDRVNVFIGSFHADGLFVE
jgi:hypothetical protein